LGIAGKLLAELFSTAVKSRHHSASRCTNNLCNLFIRKSFNICEIDNDAKLFWDFLERSKTSSIDGLEREAKSEADKLGIEYVPPKIIEQLDFSVPEGVEPFWINKGSGAKLSQGSPGAFLEYYIKGTAPDAYPNFGGGEGEDDEREASTSSYLESPDL